MFSTRDPERVLNDVRNGYVTQKKAREVYRVAIDAADGDFVLNEAETAGITEQGLGNSQQRTKKPNPCFTAYSYYCLLPNACCLRMSVDPITLQVIQARLAGIVQEMQNSLFRTGYSTIIRESQDASCAILNVGGDVVAQHVVLPLHMGAFPACAAAILKSFPAE